jgi:hypothetical protein
VRERRGSYNGFCCRLYPFICWIIIKEGPGNFSGGRSPHWVNHVNLCLYCIVCLLCFCFCICFILLLRGPVFLTKMSFGKLMLEGHALTWWEIHTETLKLEGDPLVNRWENSKTLINSQFYLIRCVENKWMKSHYFRQKQGQSV